MTSEDSGREASRDLVAKLVADYTTRRLGYYKRTGLLNEVLQKGTVIFALRGITTAGDWLHEAFAAHESSSEETMMGNAWQEIMTRLSPHSVGAGDFLVERDGFLWVMEMKSALNTLNASSLAQTLRVLKQKVRDHSGVRAPGRKGVMPMIGVLKGPPSDIWRIFKATTPENREIDGFQYRRLVGSQFRTWLTGMANPADLIEDSRERGADLVAARADCRLRLKVELQALLNEHGLVDDIKSIDQLVTLNESGPISSDP